MRVRNLLIVALLSVTALAQSTQTLGPGDSVVVWNAVTTTAVPSGTASTAVAIQANSSGSVASVSVEVNFSAAPGAFEVDIQDADTDVAGAYISIPNAAITAVNSSNFARFELSPFRARFARLLLKTQNANSATMTARISR